MKGDGTGDESSLKALFTQQHTQVIVRDEDRKCEATRALLRTAVPPHSQHGDTFIVSNAPSGRSWCLLGCFARHGDLSDEPGQGF